MSALLRPVDESFVLSRVAQTASNKRLTPEAYRVAESTIVAALTMLKEAGIETAIRIEGERHDQAVTQLVTVFESAQDGSVVGKARNAMLKKEWPQLYTALNALGKEA